MLCTRLNIYRFFFSSRLTLHHFNSTQHLRIYPVSPILAAAFAVTLSAKLNFERLCIVRSPCHEVSSVSRNLFVCSQ